MPLCSHPQTREPPSTDRNRSRLQHSPSRAEYSTKKHDNSFASQQLPFHPSFTTFKREHRQAGAMLLSPSGAARQRGGHPLPSAAHTAPLPAPGPLATLPRSTAGFRHGHRGTRQQCQQAPSWRGHRDGKPPRQAPILRPSQHVHDAQPPRDRRSPAWLPWDSAAATPGTAAGWGWGAAARGAALWGRSGSVGGHAGDAGGHGQHLQTPQQRGGRRGSASKAGAVPSPGQQPARPSGSRGRHTA